MQKYAMNQIQAALNLKTAVDKYLEKAMTDKDFEQIVRELFDTNKDNILKDGHLATNVKLKLGKKRLAILKKVLGGDLDWQ